LFFHPFIICFLVGSFFAYAFFTVPCDSPLNVGWDLTTETPAKRWQFTNFLLMKHRKQAGRLLLLDFLIDSNQQALFF